MQLVYGTVAQQDLSGDVHQYRVSLSTGALSPWMPCLVTVAGSAKHNQALSLETQVAVLLGDYDGLILGALNSSKQAPVTDSDGVARSVHKDGAMLEYDADNSALKAILPAPGKVEIISAGGIKLVGDVEIIGNVLITGNAVTTGTITVAGGLVSAADVMAGDISLLNHQHAGDSGGITSAPQ